MSLVYLHELHPLAVLIPAPFTGHNGANSYGYGNRIKTHWMVRIDGRLRRVYCICWSNSGSLYVTINKKRVFVQESCHIPAQS